MSQKDHDLYDLFKGNTFGQEKSYNILFGWVEVEAVSDDEAIKKAAQLIAAVPDFFFKDLEIIEEEEE